MIDRIPFYYKSHKEQGNGGFPEDLPFNLFFDADLKMFRQDSTEELENFLSEVYKLGSLVDGSISNESGQGYVSKTTDFIMGYINENTNSVLEVGCGSGVILNSIRKNNSQIELVGIEPGSHEIDIELDNIKIVNDFFPSKLIEANFDLVFSLLVLEHLKNPLGFLIDKKKALNDNGILIFGVPNCEPFIESGDISIFIHEHYSYFTGESLCNIAKQAGLLILDIKIIDGMYIVATKIGETSRPKNLVMKSIDYNQFNKKALLLNKRVIDFINNFDQKDTVIYAPARAINLLYSCGIRNCRLADDNSEIKGNYLPTFNSKIENFDEIVFNPPKQILIYSRTFGKKIQTKCENATALKNCSIITLNELD